MRVKKYHTKEEVLNAAKVGVEFEFYSEKDEIIDTARSIGKFLQKRVIVPVSVSSLGEEKPLYHSPVDPTDSIFKLEPDYSGGKKMCELVTGPMQYKDARNTIIKMLEWIQDNGYTNNRCSIHLNISMDGTKVPTKFKIQNMSLAKFILSFDESKIFEYFPERKDNVYARSIKQIRPNGVLFYMPNLNDFSKGTLNIPDDEKYYGVNFLKAQKGYLEYRYVGGADYERKVKKILELLEYFIAHLFDTMNSDSFTEHEINQFKKMTRIDEELYKGFIKYSVFKLKFPDIKVTVDMSDNDEVLETYWGNMRDTMYNLINTGALKKGEFNYDTELSRCQLQNAKLTNCKLQEIEFINCEVEGIIHHSWFYDCKIKNSRLEKCVLLRSNTVKSSKVAECELHTSNVCDDCYIENKNMIINCELKGGVIRNGEIGKLAKISKETLIVEGPPQETSNTGGSTFNNSAQDKKNKEKTEKKS